MRNRQLCAVTLAAASVPALLYLPRLGWVWATAAAAISALLLGLCGRRCAPGGLTEVIPAAGHRYADGICTVCGAADPNAPDPAPDPAPEEPSGSGEIVLPDLDE